MPEITLITLADKAYWKYLIKMVKSAAKNFPSAKMLVYLVNLDETYGLDLQNIHPNLRFVIESVKFSNIEQKKCYCTNRRGVILDQICKSSSDIVIWLDADSVIRKPCDELIDIASKSDIAIRKKGIQDVPKGNKPPIGFMAGLIVLSPTAAARKFIKNYNKMLDPDEWKKVGVGSAIFKRKKFFKKVWMSNQDVLYKTYLGMKDSIVYFNIPNHLLDCGFLPESVIWSVKTSMRKDPRFSDGTAEFE